MVDYKWYMDNGYFVISLDFELLWGMHEKCKIGSSQSLHVLNVHKVIPQLLDLFAHYNITATFAAVGYLFLSDIKTIKSIQPSCKPTYDDLLLSPYKMIDQLRDEERDYYVGKNLLLLIKQTKHEIASHTFCHYYCLEPGQTLKQFEADLAQAITVANDMDVEIQSLVFPRNQFNKEYLSVCKERGIKVVRSTEKGWMYKASSAQKNNLIKRAFRLLDAYINISGYNCYTVQSLIKDPVLQLPSSCFLRPYSSRLKLLEYFRLRRILKGMTYAAKKNEIFHLWWHPHNMGVNIEENFAFLEKILSHYEYLHTKYAFQSVTMSHFSKYSHG